MASVSRAPEEFSQLTDLAQDATGTFVVYATDDYFAGKENLLKPGPAVWLENEYTDKGKWMDGWESQRRRVAGGVLEGASLPSFADSHDFAIIRLGTPGSVHGVLVDTTHFKGNAPQDVLVEGLEAPHTLSVEKLVNSPNWEVLLPKTPVKPDFQNSLRLPRMSPRVTHLRLRIYPDGGVARFRAYGVVLPEAKTFWQSAAVDLAAIENGGTVASASDQFFGPPANLLLPGRGVNMGDGWETKRRRTPGSDWCVLKLGRRGVLQRLELDTHFFKGNAPQAVLVEALDETTLSQTELEARLKSADASGWMTLCEKTPVVQHRRHILEPSKPLAVTHVRVHIFPHGGVNRLRMFGHAVDTEGERRAMEKFNALGDDDARTLLRSFNGSSQWASTLLGARPFASVREFFALADAAWWKLDEKAHLEAFAAHPRLGDAKKPASQTEQSSSWSKTEQQGIAGAGADALGKLKTANDEYFEKFGFIFILFASGRSAVETLEILEQRVRNTREQELDTAAREQGKITRMRMEKWLTANRGE